MDPLRIVCVHGIGNHRDNPEWQVTWENALATAVRQAAQTPDGAGGRRVEIEFVMHDNIFERYPLTAADWAAGLATLAASGLWHGVQDLVTRERGLFDQASYWMRWYAGMVAQWSASDRLRAELRATVLSAIERHEPHLLIGHSLGSLVTYDTLVQAIAKPPKPKVAAILQQMSYMSLGSQIGNPTVRSTFGGRIVMPPAKQWFHLYNPTDRALTAEVRLVNPKFEQLATPFDEPGTLWNHHAEYYFAHRTTQVAWRAIAAPQPAVRAMVGQLRVVESTRYRPRTRALIVGINEYADPAANLEGCVNDAFLMSSVLQETGFAAEDIRVLLDGRATADAIRERLQWLLDDVQPGDVRFFHFSGHGAQIPGYGPEEKVDRLDECLVPHDFDWTAERAILDDWLYERYSQLPYDARFIAVLDCCHSGGLARAGGVRVRGIDPPDDIRHRALKWNAETGLWEPRDLAAADESLADHRRFSGESGAVFALGRARQLRTLPDRKFNRVRRELGHLGPYLPVLYEACREAELAEEYRHGATPHGAFTFALAETLRRSRLKKTRLTFQQLLDGTAAALRSLGRAQHPGVLGPTKILSAEIPLRFGDDLPPQASPPTPATATPPAGKRPTKKPTRKKPVRKRPAARRR